MQARLVQVELGCIKTHGGWRLDKLFRIIEVSMIPGEVIYADGDIEINVGRKTLSIEVANTGDRPIQIGSHYHFYEVNPALTFKKEQTKGFRLNIAAGTAVRFEPGQTRTVELVEFSGKKEIYGFRGEVQGKV